MLLLLGIAVAFVAIGFWLRNEQPIFSVLGIVFFGLCGMVALISLHPRASYLTLTESGFECASLFRKHFTPWSDVAAFFPISIGSHRMVGWDYVAGYARAPSMRKANLALANSEAALPDTYGHTPMELARVMNELREKYTAVATTGC